MPAVLSEAQLQQFNDLGYLVVEDLLDAETLAAVKTEYSELLDDLYDGWHSDGLVEASPEGLSFWEKFGNANRAGMEWFQPFDISLPHDGITNETPMHFGPAVFKMATHKRILDLVEQLIGPEITSNPIQHVRIKPPRRDVDAAEKRAHVVKTDWHQDMGVTNVEANETQFITVWLAITDATLDNGCLQVAPGRREEVLPHCAAAGAQVGIANDFIPRDQAIPTPVKAGGAVILHPMTPHGSLENLSDGYRWSFDLRYNITGQNTGRSHFPEFVARSRSNPSTELQDWRGWLKMWQDTRSHLARVEHINQHGRWSADRPYCA